MSKLVVSSGGHIYDRTTGTWQGETQGTVEQGMQGMKHGPSDDGGKVWHDANGISGISYDTPTTPAVGRTAANGGGAGAAAGAVTTDGPGSAGSGAGAPAVTMGPVRPRGTGPLKMKLEPNVTKVMAGGDWWDTNPWFSDAEQWTTRYGEGELAETFFFLTTSVSDVTWNAGRFGDWLGREAEKAATRLDGGLQSTWVEPDTPAFNPDANWQ